MYQVRIDLGLNRDIDRVGRVRLAQVGRHQALGGRVGRVRCPSR